MAMTVGAALISVLLQEDLDFLLTNRLPRRLATHLAARISRIEHPIVSRPALAAWRFFARPDLSDSASDRFASLYEGFTRALRPGERPFDPPPPYSQARATPSSVHMRDRRGPALSGQGLPYRLRDLLPDPALAHRFRKGRFLTLRLTAGMYHRFHAPADLKIDAVTYLSGDCWNVNPIALKRVERLFCRNEWAVIEARVDADGTPLLIVPVAAILVASIRLGFIDTRPLARALGAERHAMDVAVSRGAEMGWFEHGSIIICFVPTGVALSSALGEGRAIRAGQPIAYLPSAADDAARS